MCGEVSKRSGEVSKRSGEVSKRSGEVSDGVCGEVSDGVCEKIRKIKSMAMDNDGVRRWTMMVCGDGQCLLV